MKKYLLTFCLFLLIFPNISYAVTNCGDADANTWCVETADTSFNGASDCGGSCTGDSEIIINTGRTLGISFYNLTGASGNRLAIKNPSDSKVTISEAGSTSVTFYDSTEFEFRGDSWAGSTCVGSDVDDAGVCGIRLTGGTRGIRVFRCKEFEITGIEIDNMTSTAGILWQDQGWVQSDGPVTDVSINNNYIHDITTEGVYLGNSSVGDYPQFDAFQFFENTIVNTGWDGIQIGQLTNSDNNIYSNTVINAGTSGTSGQNHGIIINREVNGGELYSNKINTTNGNGIYVSVDAANLTIKNNVILNAGGDGVTNVDTDGYVTIISNTVVSAGYYGIESASDNSKIQYNLLINNASGGCESITAGALDCNETNNNRTSASLAGEYFYNSASIDGLYLTYQSPAINDSDNTAGYATTDFSGSTRPYGSTYADPGAYEFVFKAASVSPADNDTSVSVTVQPTWQNPETTTGVYVYFDKTTNPPTTEVVSGTLVETFNPGTLDGQSEYFMKINLVHAHGTETGDVYSFTTTEVINPPTAPSNLQFLKKGAALEWNKNGSVLQ